MSIHRDSFLSGIYTTTQKQNAGVVGNRMNPSQNPSALRSKRVILETLSRLMEQYSYQEITVKQIILESDISRKTFYRNFTSKDDVLISYLNTVLDQYMEAIKEQGAYSIIAMLEIVFDFCEKNKELLIMLRNNELLYLMIMRLNRMIPEQHQKITRHIKQAAADEKTSYLPQYVISFNIGGIWNIIVQWIENDMRDDSEDIKKMLVYYLSNIQSLDLRDI